MRDRAQPTLVEDPDIFRAARLLIDQHGDDAMLWAELRAKVLKHRDDLDGSRVWYRILLAIGELRRTRRRSDSVH